MWLVPITVRFLYFNADFIILTSQFMLFGYGENFQLQTCRIWASWVFQACFTWKLVGWSLNFRPFWYFVHKSLYLHIQCQCHSKMKNLVSIIQCIADSYVATTIVRSRNLYNQGSVPTQPFIICKFIASIVIIDTKLFTILNDTGNKFANYKWLCGNQPRINDCGNWS